MSTACCSHTLGVMLSRRSHRGRYRGLVLRLPGIWLNRGQEGPAPAQVAASDSPGNAPTHTPDAPKKAAARLGPRPGATDFGYVHNSNPPYSSLRLTPPGNRRAAPKQTVR